MTDEIDKAIAETLAGREQTTAWACRNCGLMFDSSRDARQHCFGEHEEPMGIKRLTDNEADDE
jgi:hypothetical protein